MKQFVYLLIGALALSSMSGCRCADEAVDVAHDELGPRALLKKYEWFKDAAAALDAKVAGIKVQQKKLDALTEQYEGVPRSKWARDDREQWNQTSSELAGVKQSYNDLASEYNAQMAKENWAFTNVGTLPPGATTPLPRSYKPYVEE
jgi:hypothetical protein